MSKKDPGKLLKSLDAIGRRMAALRAGALTTEEAIAKAAAKAKELREAFPLDVDALFAPGSTAAEQLEAIQKFQATGFGGPKPSDMQGTQAQNIPRQTLADLAAMSPEAQARALRGGVGPGMSTGSGWAAGAEGAVNPGIYIPPDYSEAARQRREQRAGGWNQAAADQVIAALRTMIDRLEQVFGFPTYVGQILEQQIRNLEAKVSQPDEVLAFARYVLGTMSAGLQQEALSPVAAIRNVANDLLRFVGGAALPGGHGSLTVGPRANPPAGAEAPAESAEATFSSRVGAAVSGAVRGEVAGLGATFTRGVESQANRVLAGVNERTGAVLSTVSAQSAALRTIREEQVRANRELAEQYREIGRTTVRVDEGVRALGRNTFSAAALRDELERLNLSGRLGVS